jgi:hypothetical protein
MIIILFYFIQIKNYYGHVTFSTQFFYIIFIIKTKFMTPSKYKNVKNFF